MITVEKKQPTLPGSTIWVTFPNVPLDHPGYVDSGLRAQLSDDYFWTAQSETEHGRLIATLDDYQKKLDDYEFWVSQSAKAEETYEKQKGTKFAEAAVTAMVQAHAEKEKSADALKFSVEVIRAVVLHIMKAEAERDKWAGLVDPQPKTTPAYTGLYKELNEAKDRKARIESLQRELERELAKLNTGDGLTYKTGDTAPPSDNPIDGGRSLGELFGVPGGAPKPGSGSNAAGAAGAGPTVVAVAPGVGSPGTELEFAL